MIIIYDINIINDPSGSFKFIIMDVGKEEGCPVIAPHIFREAEYVGEIIVCR